jgi:hypothetical protein
MAKEKHETNTRRQDNRMKNLIHHENLMFKYNPGLLDEVHPWLVRAILCLLVD